MFFSTFFFTFVRFRLWGLGCTWGLGFTIGPKGFLMVFEGLPWFETMIFIS